MNDQGAWNLSKTYHVGQDLGYFFVSKFPILYTTQPPPPPSSTVS